MWWAATVEGGEVGFGVLFKRMVKTKTLPESKKQDEKTAEQEQDEHTSSKEQETPKGETGETMMETPQIHNSPEEQPAEISVEKEKSANTHVIEKPVIETVVAIHRVDPSKEDIRGYFECKEDGCLEFGFDNSFSYFRSKTIELTVSVVNA